MVCIGMNCGLYLFVLVCIEQMVCIVCISMYLYVFICINLYWYVLNVLVCKVCNGLY